MVIIIIIFRVVVDKKVEFQDIIYTIIETPIEISGLTISFLISYMVQILSKIAYIKENYNEKILQLVRLLGNAIVFFMILLVILVITIILSKRMKSKYNSSNENKYVYIALLGYVVIFPALIYAIKILKELGGI